VALLQQGGLQRLACIAGKGEGHQPAGTVLLGAELLEPLQPTGHERLQGVAAAGGDFDTGQPQLARPSSSISVPPSSTAATVAVPSVVSLQAVASCALAPHTIIAQANAAGAIVRMRRRFMMAAGCRMSLQCGTIIDVIVTTGEGTNVIA
jgi:hypothetical protein